MKYCLFLNGEIPSREILPDFKQYSLVLCTDGAFHYLQNLQIDVDYILGDFDSLNKTDWLIDKRFIHLEDQNYTDFEKSINFLLNKFTEDDISLDIFAANGKESDHFLGNLSLAKKYIDKIEMNFYDAYQSYFLTKKSIQLHCVIGDLISIFPFPFARNISSKGLRYNISNETMEMGNFIGIRNEAIESRIEIEFLDGCLIIFRGNHEQN